MKTETLLHEEIESQFQELGKIAVGTDDYKAAVDGVTKLLDREIKLKELEIASYDKEKEFEQKEKELTLKEEQLKDESRDRKIKNAITVGNIMTTAGLAVWGTIASFKFEKNDSITTILGRGWINKLIPKK